tara:strand:+ start:87 stop:398 length:312 start_codon:yes stop_codon:yes gene_type:complete
MEGLENGTLHTAEAFAIAEELDDLLIYFILRFLREKYHSNTPEGPGVMARILDLSQNHPSIVQKSQMGEKDILREWFDETFNMQEFFPDPEKLLHTIIDKIEG